MKTKILGVVAACVLALTIGQAKAESFNVVASWTLTQNYVIYNVYTPGVIGTIDIEPGSVSSVNICFDAPTCFPNIVSQGPDAVSPYYDVATQTPQYNTGFGFGLQPCTTTNGCHDTLFLLLSADPSTLIADQGGSVSGSWG